MGKYQQKAYACILCGKEGHSTNIKAHIETKHIESSITHSCDICGKISKSRFSLRKHKIKQHFKQTGPEIVWEFKHQKWAITFSRTKIVLRMHIQIPFHHKWICFQMQCRIFLRITLDVFIAMNCRYQVNELIIMKQHFQVWSRTHSCHHELFHDP